MASTNKTEGYSLNQWVRSDPVLMADFNEDNARIDAALSAIAQAAAVAGNCRIVAGSYTGTGSYGGSSNGINTLFFEGEPLFIIVFGPCPMFLPAKMTTVYYQYATSSYSQSVVWSAGQVKWYTNNGNSGYCQCNSNNIVYPYVVVYGK